MVVVQICGMHGVCKYETTDRLLAWGSGEAEDSWVQPCLNRDPFPTLNEFPGNY